MGTMLQPPAISRITSRYGTEGSTHSPYHKNRISECLQECTANRVLCSLDSCNSVNMGYIFRPCPIFIWIRQGSNHHTSIYSHLYAAISEMTPRSIFILLAVFGLFLTACTRPDDPATADESPQAPDTETQTQPAERVYFAEPANGTTVGTTFNVVMAAEGILVEPAGEVKEGSGHFHILVNTDYVAPGQVIPADEQHLHYGTGATETELTLEPGTYTLRLQFADGAHVTLDGDQYRDEIQVTVE